MLPICINTNLDNSSQLPNGIEKDRTMQTLFRYIKSYLFFFFLLGIPYLVFCQNPSSLRFEHLTVEDGLSSPNVFSMLQDRSGVIWFGTDKGLNRFDGYEFVVLKNDLNDSLSLGGNYVSSIFEDSIGNLWIATDSILNKYDDTHQTFRRINLGKNGFDNRIMVINEIDSNTLILGTRSGLILLNKANGNTKQFRHNPNDSLSLSNDGISSIHITNNRMIWIGTMWGLNLFDPESEKFRRFLWTQNDPKGTRLIFSLLQNRENQLLVGTNISLAVLDLLNLDKPIKHHYFGRAISEIYKDNKDIIWLGTRRGELLRLQDIEQEKGVWYRPDPTNTHSLTSQYINKIIQDNENIIWIASDAGIHRITPEAVQFQIFNHHPRDTNSLSINHINCILEDQEGIVWIGTQGGSLNSFDPRVGEFRHYSYINHGHVLGPNHPSILSLFEDSQGIIWLGTAGAGIDRLIDREKGQFLHYRVYNPSDWIGFTSEAQDSFIYIGSLGGLTRYNRTTNEFKFFPFFLDESYTKSVGITTGIVEDEQKNIWSGNYAGLFRFDPRSESYKHFTSDHRNPNSISHNSVLNIFKDGQNRIWVATENGLNLLNSKDEIFKSFFGKEKQFEIAMGPITEDEKGLLWICSESGLLVFDPEKHEFQNFNKHDGLVTNELTSIFHSKNTGKVYLGTTQGLHIYHPDSLRKSDYVPPVRITSFKYYNRKDGIGKVIKDNYIFWKKTIQLSYHDNILTFQFAVLSYRKTPKNQYAYRLEGLNDNWINLGTTREVTFTNLAPGNYILRVKGSNGDGVWNADGTSLAIRILPPWWRTCWAYLLYAIIILWSLFIFYRFQIHRKLIF